MKASDLFGKTVSIFYKNIFAFLGLITLPLISSILLCSQTVINEWVCYLLLISLGFFGILVEGAFTFVTSDTYHEKTVSWKDAFFRSFKRCHRLIGASILYPLAIFLGLQFFVLPALIVYINLYCFLPIMLLEDKPVIKSWMLSNELMASSASNVLGPLKLWVVYMIISGLSLATTFTLMKLDISSIPVAITLIIFSFIVDVSGKIFGIIAPTVYYEHVKANSQ